MGVARVSKLVKPLTALIECLNILFKYFQFFLAGLFFCLFPCLALPQLCPCIMCVVIIINPSLIVYLPYTLMLYIYLDI